MSASLPSSPPSQVANALTSDALARSAVAPSAVAPSAVAPSVLAPNVLPGDALLPESSQSGAGDAVESLQATDHAPREGAPSPREQVKSLVEKTLAARPQLDADLLERASLFAALKHEGQRRMTGEPYIEHPIAVAGILAELGMDDVTIAAGLLHDVPEDCNVSYDEMQERFGADVAHLVEGVTKLKHIRFDTKADKQAENLRKLFLAMAGDVRVIIVKLADRLHNMRTLDPFPEHKRIEIADETLNIFAPIAHRLGIWRVKWELEDRAFKYLEPQVYKQIYALVQRTRGQRAAQVQEATAQLSERLREEGIEAQVTGRPKHFYSIYQKMLKQGLKFDAIHDLIALRVITRSKPDCYHALGVVHALWMQVPEMFFDYIAKPKPNNYQSLHTKVLDEEGELLEVQIRTAEMHRNAEFGIAAHWRYKDDTTSAKAFGDRLRWLRPVLEMQEDTGDDTKGYLDSLKIDLAAEQVFVFTPRGDVIYLPVGSTPVDFAFRVHSEVGNACTGAKVNGRIVPLNHKLHNGDICEIITSRSSRGPKRGWLDFVVTPHARARIKAFLRKTDFSENLRHGLLRLEKAARAERFKLEGGENSAALKKVARQMGQKGAPELLAAIGYGEFSALSILHKLRLEVEGESQKETLSRTATSLLGKRPEFEGNLPAPLGDLLEGEEGGEGDMAFGASGEIELDPAKSDGFSYNLARCCAPVPGDEVRGYITRGRGMTVHRAACANLRHYESREPDRIVRAQWSSEPDRPYSALIAIESSDRAGLLADVTSIIAARQINISAVNTYPLKAGRARLNIAITIRSCSQLDEIVNLLGTVSGVTDVHRA